MTLEEAIKYAEDMAALSHKGSGNAECEHNHRQLAEWLRELEQLRQAAEDIRREIKNQAARFNKRPEISYDTAYSDGLYYALDIIDKYITESDPQESEDEYAT